MFLANVRGEIYIHFIPEGSKYYFQGLSTAMLVPGQQEEELGMHWKTTVILNSQVQQEVQD